MVSWLFKRKLEFISTVYSKYLGSKTPPRLVLALNVVQETLPPDIYISIPSSNLVIGRVDEDAGFSIRYGDDDEVDSSSVLVRLDGQEINSFCDVTANSAECLVPGLSTGLHKLQVSLSDLEGNVGEGSRLFLFLDSDRPESIFASVWNRDNGLPIDRNAKNSDLHLDASTGDVYQKNSGRWEYVSNVYGEDGLTGPTGETGDKGLIGDQGEKGLKGETGAIGIQGPIGMKGETGNAGPQGVAGVKGESGEPGMIGTVGLVGPKGLAGERGIKGVDGLKGEKGDAGTSFYVAKFCPSGQALLGFDSVGDIVCR
jgi:hypothetical protein